MKSQQSILIVIFVGLLLSIVRGVTYHVPVDFRTIQSAIEASSYNGDTIIVAPGTYIENIDYVGKNIYIGSHYIYGNTDASIINRTIIDGNENGAVVTFYGGETRDAVLNGFTITNGNGRHSPSGISAYGGGLFIRESNPSIMNCVIRNNTAFGLGAGGGMCLMDSDAFLSNLIITENLAFKGGGIFLIRSNIEMDQRKRCSIFLNNASTYNDIFNNFFSSDIEPRIYLDTASVDSLDEYFIGGNYELVDILNAKIEKVAHDLYVSPEGCNNNSGLTPDDPLKTITYALHIIHADSLNPRTIHLISGQFSPAVFSRSLGQVFPAHLRSYVTIKGEGQERTIIDLEGTYLTAIAAINYQKYVTISSMSVINGSAPPGEFLTHGFWMNIILSKSEGLIIEDMKFENISIKSLTTGFYTTSILPPVPNNSSFIVRNCRFENNTGKFASISSGQMLMQNCIISNNEINHDYYSCAVSFTSTDSLTELRVENCSFTNNTNYSDNPEDHNVNIAFGNYRGLKFANIVNCTFADGNSLWGSSISIYCEDASRLGMKTDFRFVNCILWNDNIPWELWYEENYQNEGLSFLRFAYNDIQNEMWNMAFIGYIDYVYEDTNIDMLPLFNNDYTLQPNSPCIDAGTAFYVYEGDTIVNLSPDEYYGSAPDMGAYEWRPTVGIDDNLLLLPGNVAISSVYPNPFNSSTTIKYQVPNSGKINLSIYDITGRLVEKLIDAYVRMGEHKITINVSHLASGMYILRLKTKTGSNSRQIGLIK